MGISVKNFTGTWYVWWGDGEQQVLKRGWKIVLGKNEDGATEPSLSPDYNVIMGFSILELNTDGPLPHVWTSVFSTEDQQQQPLELMFVDGTLRWAGYYKGQPLRIYISICEAETTANESSFALYGSTVYGDPDQVGVWGAGDRPPGG